MLLNSEKLYKLHTGDIGFYQCVCLKNRLMNHTDEEQLGVQLQLSLFSMRLLEDTCAGFRIFMMQLIVLVNIYFIVYTLLKAVSGTYMFNGALSW